MLITRIRNLDGPLTKTFSLKDGQLVKAAAANLVNGMAHRVHVDSLEHFAKIVTGLTSQEALTFGVPVFEQGRITTQDHVKAGRAPRGAVPRDESNFVWHKGATGLMLDIDQPKDGSEPFTSTTFDAMLCERLPWWSSVGRFYKPSVSAFISGPDGKQYTGIGSMRCYAIVDKGPNVPFIGIQITDTLWKAGYGRIEFDAAERAHPKCPIDTTVWQASRLDFQGAGIFHDGLRQKKYAPRIFPGDHINSEAVLSSGIGKQTFTQWRSNSIEVRKALHAVRPEARTRRRAYIGKKVDEDVAAGIERKIAERKWRAALEAQELTGSFTLHFRDRGTVTVAEVLKNPDKFNRERLADPAEPTYANDGRIAQFYANEYVDDDGVVHYRPFIYSHAHSTGAKYSLKATA